MMLGDGAITFWRTLVRWPHIPIALGSILLARTIFAIATRRSAATTFWSGVALILFGVFGPLFGSIYDTGEAPAVHDFTRDLFLIVAAIGANWVVSAALAFDDHSRLLPAVLWALLDRRKLRPGHSDDAARKESVLAAVRRQPSVEAADQAIQPRPVDLPSQKQDCADDDPRG